MEKCHSVVVVRCLPVNEAIIIVLDFFFFNVCATRTVSLDFCYHFYSDEREILHSLIKLVYD